MSDCNDFIVGPFSCGVVKNIGVLIVSAAIIFGTAWFGQCADIALDPGFGENGVALTELGPIADGGEAIALQSDGKIVVAGWSQTGLDRDFAVVRYLADGSVDPSFYFSAGPIVGGGFGDDAASAVVAAPDGSLLVGGTIEEDGVRSAVLIKILSTGQLDLQFGQQGVAALVLPDYASTLADIIQLVDGSVIGVGSVTDNSGTFPLIVQFTENGAIAEEFGDQGVVVDRAQAGELQALSLQTSPAALVLAGYILDQDGNQGLYLSQYSLSGQQVPDFGVDGEVIVFNPSEELRLYDIAVLEQGDIVVIGEALAQEDEPRMLVGRFSSSGEADLEFGEDGLIVHDSGTASGLRALGVMADGTVIAAGYQRNGTDYDTVLLDFATGTEPTVAEPNVSALNSPTILGESGQDGSIRIGALSVSDGSFTQQDVDRALTQAEDDGTAATVRTTEMAGTDEVGQALAIDQNGAIFTAGTSGTEDESAFLVASYSMAARTSEPVGGAGPVRSTYYALETMPVTDITRVGALTGGMITLLNLDTAECIAECEAECTGTEEEINTCQDACSASCAAPTVDQRGVVYATEPEPQLDTDETDNGDSGAGDDTDSDGDIDQTAISDNQDTDGSTGISSNNPFGLESLFNFDNYFVRQGQTEDGSGSGAFTSEIDGINPQTTYYVRAYAVLSDGSILYGNEYRFKTEDSCFIATAAFGSFDSIGVRLLRQFRDRYLKPYQSGRHLIAVYYHFSPPAAAAIQHSVVLRVCSWLLLLPLVIGAAVLLYVPLSANVLLIGTSLGWWAWRGKMMRNCI